jgi:hypothetical protein
MRTGAEAFGLGVTQVSFVESIEKVCNKEKSVIHNLMKMIFSRREMELCSWTRVKYGMRGIG